MRVTIKILIMWYSSSVVSLTVSSYFKVSVYVIIIIPKFSIMYNLQISVVLFAFEGFGSSVFMVIQK